MPLQFFLCLSVIAYGVSLVVAVDIKLTSILRMQFFLCLSVIADGVSLVVAVDLIKASASSLQAQQV